MLGDYDWNELDQLFEYAVIIGNITHLHVIRGWNLEYCFNYIKENGGVIRIDISKTPLQRMLDNVTSY